jgi:hypothetical protein
MMLLLLLLLFVQAVLCSVAGACPLAAATPQSSTEATAR